MGVTDYCFSERSQHHMTSVSLFLDVYHVRTIPLTPEPSGLLPSPTRGEGDKRTSARSSGFLLPLGDGGGWVGVTGYCFSERSEQHMTSVSLFLDVHHVRTIPLTPEPSGLLPSPTRGEGDMR